MIELLLPGLALLAAVVAIAVVEALVRRAELGAALLLIATLPPSRAGRRSGFGCPRV